MLTIYATFGRRHAYLRRVPELQLSLCTAQLLLDPDGNLQRLCALRNVASLSLLFTVMTASVREHVRSLLSGPKLQSLTLRDCNTPTSAMEACPQGTLRYLLQGQSEMTTLTELCVWSPGALRLTHGKGTMALLAQRCPNLQVTHHISQ